MLVVSIAHAYIFRCIYRKNKNTTEECCIDSIYNVEYYKLLYSNAFEDEGDERSYGLRGAGECVVLTSIINRLFTLIIRDHHINYPKSLCVQERRTFYDRFKEKRKSC